MTSIEKYEEEFKDLSIDKARSDMYNANAAPHKPILLLSLMHLYEEGKVNLSNIDPESALARNSDVKTLSRELWAEMGYERTYDISKPFYYLKKEDFWNIKLKDDYSSPIPKNKKGPTQKDLKERIEKVYFDSELVTLLNDDDNRERLMKALLSGKNIEWFTKEDKGIIKEKMDL